MNERIQAILLKMILNVKKSKMVGLGIGRLGNYLKSEEPCSINKKDFFCRMCTSDNENFRDQIETYLDLKLKSDDEITYFPDYTIYAQIVAVPGLEGKDVAYKMDADVAFTKDDFRDDRKIKSGSDRINKLVENHIDMEYSDYISVNIQKIKNAQQKWK